MHACNHHLAAIALICHACQSINASPSSTAYSQLHVHMYSLLLNNSLLFCTASINVTNTSCPAETLICDCGTIKWPEITPNVTAYAPCPNGPDGAQANRTCGENGTWESPNTALCATTAVSNSYRNISKVRCSQLLLLFVYF